MKSTLFLQRTSERSANRSFFAKNVSSKQSTSFFTDQHTGPIQRQTETATLPEEKEEEQVLQQKPLETIQRMCAECEAEQEEQSALQKKLSVGEAGDQYEQEADRVADQVVDHLQTAQEPSVQTKLDPAFPSITPLVMRQGEGSAAAAPQVEQGIQQSRGSGEPLTQPIRRSMEQAFGTDFSGVRIHANGEADTLNRSLSARAFTSGQEVFFKSGEYQPESPAGQKLLAHELTHVVQQSGANEIRVGQSSKKGSLSPNVPANLFRVGAPEGLIQRRRVPSGAGLGAALPTALPMSGAELPGVSARIGVALLLRRAWAGLTTAQQATVRAAAAGFGLNWSSEENLQLQLRWATRDQLVQFADAIRTAAPSAELGDPLLINTGARLGTTDAANITTLVTNADAVFATIAGGSRDADIAQVFGAANVATAKTKYANAQTRMNALNVANKIVTDRSGYSAEVGLGGLSNSSQIAVAPSVIDNPGNNGSVITLIHESMHAGNSDVHDFGYISQPSFTALAESVKLTNAAHFEVVPRRILGASFAFSGQTFIPAGTTVGGVAAPALTPREEAIRGASEAFRAAWTIGLNLHTLFVRLFRTPTEWNTLNLSTRFSGAPAGAHFADTLPFWSNVERLTIHSRASSIDPAGTPDVRPVTLIDIALSEGLIRKLSQGMDNVPQDEGVALAFEAAHATSSELTAAAASVNAERDLLIRLIIRVHLGSITGTESRDERVVAQMALPNLWSSILAVRPPSAFP